MFDGRKNRKLPHWQVKLITSSLTLTVFLLAFISILTLGNFLNQRDLQGAATQSAHGVVTSEARFWGGRGHTPVAFTQNDVTYTCWVYQRFWKNEHVLVIYRIGKSGRIYIDYVEPEGDAKP